MTGDELVRVKPRIGRWKKARVLDLEEFGEDEDEETERRGWGGAKREW